MLLLQNLVQPLFSYPWATGDILFIKIIHHGTKGMVLDMILMIIIVIAILVVTIVYVLNGFDFSNSPKTKQTSHSRNA